MSKSTKIIAALGVVAGLGVAALPAFTYAAVDTTGNAEVVVEVTPAIAMKIEGNNDTAGDTTDDYQPWVSYDNNGDGQGYEEAANGSTFTIGSFNGTVQNVKPSSSKTQLSANAKIDGDTENGFMSTVTVYTNNTYGYQLTLADADGSEATPAQLALSDGNGHTIAAGTTISEGTSNWAYKVGAGNYTAITGTDAFIDGSNAKTGDTGRATQVFYGVSTSASQDTGIYKNLITYTATTFDSAQAASAALGN